MNTQLWFLSLVSLVALPALGFAQADLSGVLAKDFYCSTSNFASGSTGVLIGLAVAAFGFYKFIFSGGGLGNILLIAGGVLFTAIPTWFAAGIDTLGSVFSSVQGQTPGAVGACNTRNASQNFPNGAGP